MVTHTHRERMRMKVSRNIHKKSERKVLMPSKGWQVRWIIQYIIDFLSSYFAVFYGIDREKTKGKNWPWYSIQWWFTSSEIYRRWLIASPLLIVPLDKRYIYLLIDYGNRSYGTWIYIFFSLSLFGFLFFLSLDFNNNNTRRWQTKLSWSLHKYLSRIRNSPSSTKLMRTNIHLFPIVLVLPSDTHTNTRIRAFRTEVTIKR